MKKLTAYFLIAVTLWASVIAPARAFVPLLFPAAVGSITTAEGTIALAAAASTVGIGSLITYVAMTNDGNLPASDGSNTAIQIQLDPYTPLTTPASASAPATSPYTQQEVVISDLQVHWTSSACGSSTILRGTDGPSLWSKLNPLCSWDSQHQYVYVSDTFSTAGPYYITAKNTYNNTTMQANASKVNSCLPGSTWNGSDCVGVQNVCPTGYTLNTTTQSCNLSNPDQQIADQKIQITRTGDTLQQNPNDPDPIPENLLVRPKDIVISHPQRTYTVHINDDGTIDVGEITHTPQGNTNVNNLKLSAPGPGQAPEVVSKSNQQYPGQESGPANPESTVSSPIIPGTSGGTPSSPAASTTVLNLPENLAKTDKQCGYDAEHPCKVELKNEAIESTQLSTGQFETAASDHLSNLQDVGEGGDHGFSWSWNPFESINAGACTPPQFHVGFVDLNFSDFCTKIAWVRDLLGFVIYVSTGMALFSIMTGKREE